MPVPTPYQVLLYYSYHPVPDPVQHHQWHHDLCQQLQLRGRIRIASEGLNGTVSGTVPALTAYRDAIEACGLFPGIQWKVSESKSGHAFANLRVDLRPNIVNIGATISLKPGRHLTPAEFHQALLDHEDALIIDCRNLYEWKIGRFRGAVRPPCRQFSDFPRQVDDLVKTGAIRTDRRVLMYCTGGIRCEMGSSYLKSCGFQQVHQLLGGIHEYLNVFPDGGLFHGKNFVFDERIALSSGSDRIVGRCDGCSSPYDDYSARRRCRYCRVLMLICDDCSESNPGAFICGLCPASQSHGLLLEAPVESSSVATV